MRSEPTPHENEIAAKAIGCAIRVHRTLGPGLLESIYETCFTHELAKVGFEVHRQKPQRIVYEGIVLEDALRLDLVVNDIVLIEVKAVEKIQPIHKAQLRTYLKLANRRLGLLINFNSELVKNDIHRVVNGEVTD
ncbi:GxxExxY protein [Roseimicrobium gellanilyticum]|uniref:GxxExxY protein n=1 Tax=Roseimicrobium gellanilyticum TaxID=748857 RepID=A0A366HUT4_9BACT|nr:GxxExxY protein [Roseimicrobium gellanilyticum]RBP47294.1 GxxExxY protein [Roseimicrobium gellanilyticum]